MSISSEDLVAGPYDGDDTTVILPFGFKVFNTSQVLVVRTDELDVETVLTLGTDYTVSLNPNQDAAPGGSITLTAPAVTGHKTTLTSDIENLQPITLTNAGGFYPAVLNAALDRLTIMVQQVAEKAARSVKVPISSSTDPNALIAQLTTDAATAATQAGIATSAAATATTQAGIATAAAATIPAYPSLAGNELKYPRLNGAASSMEFRAPAEVLADIGAQPYDADTAKTDVAQAFTAPQRSALLTDNDGNFDLSAKQNFKCTPTAGITLTFSDQADGLSGSVVFVNSANYAIAAHANTKLTVADLAKLSATGTYRIDYLSDGTNAYCSVVGAYA